MRLDNSSDIKVIGQTIRAVAKAQSERLFKSERNTAVRTAFVFITIRGEVTLALLDAGVEENALLGNAVDPTDEIVDAMIAVGFVFEEGEAIDSIESIFGPVGLVDDDGIGDEDAYESIVD